MRCGGKKLTLTYVSVHPNHLETTTAVMSTPKQIENQLNLECKSIEIGIAKLRKQTKKLEEQSYASASLYGVSAISDLMPHLVRHLEKTEHRINSRRNGPMYKEISMFLEYLSKDEACLIALKVFFDKVFSGKDKKERFTKVKTIKLIYSLHHVLPKDLY